MKKFIITEEERNRIRNLYGHQNNLLNEVEYDEWTNLTKRLTKNQAKGNISELTIKDDYCEFLIKYENRDILVLYNNDNTFEAKTYPEPSTTVARGAWSRGGFVITVNKKTISNRFGNFKKLITKGIDIFCAPTSQMNELAKNLPDATYNQQNGAPILEVVYNGIAINKKYIKVTFYQNMQYYNVVVDNESTSGAFGVWRKGGKELYDSNAKLVANSDNVLSNINMMLESSLGESFKIPPAQTPTDQTKTDQNVTQTQDDQNVTQTQDDQTKTDQNVTQTQTPTDQTKDDQTKDEVVGQESQGETKTAELKSFGFGKGREQRINNRIIKIQQRISRLEKELETQKMAGEKEEVQDIQSAIDSDKRRIQILQSKIKPTVTKDKVNQPVVQTVTEPEQTSYELEPF